MFHQRYSFGGQEFLNNQQHPTFDLLSQRPYNQTLMKKPIDDEDSRHGTLSMSSASPTTINPKLSIPNDPSPNVKLDLSPPLSEMSVNDICECIKNDIAGLKSTMIPAYIHDINEYNISGKVLATCNIDELKQILSMRFGDWVLFHSWVETKREEEKRFHFHRRTKPSCVIDNRNQHPTLPKNDSLNEYQLYTENSVLGAALSRLMAQNGTTNMNDEASTASNEGISIVSAPKNVKFLIPLTRSGITSNESTFGVIESSTRTITHVKDIFPLNSQPPSQKLTATTSNNEDTATPSLSNSITVSSCLDDTRHTNQNEFATSDSEQQPLLQNKNSDQK